MKVVNLNSNEAINCSELDILFTLIHREYLKVSNSLAIKTQALQKAEKYLEKLENTLIESEKFINKLKKKGN